ncbi:hypothetical protein J1605_015471 [Eschrichtius robustus]|uniref:Uncharacterized protein n=1 Tax=Eschrichtius robustus TaxID=9764 RepID=A0AB34G9F5_ESCRO|nr:hypothetical protein J1605_015471 [Eschrichtius robustus]
MPQLLKPPRLESVLCNKRSHRSEKPVHRNEESLQHKVMIALILRNKLDWASLVAQWLRIHLPMRGTRVQALVREDPTCRRATKSMRHNY